MSFGDGSVLFDLGGFASSRRRHGMELGSLKSGGQPDTAIGHAIVLRI